MKFTKIAVAVAFALAGGRVYAFHSGGVAECDGCHTMHNSSEAYENEFVNANNPLAPVKPQMTTTNRGVGNANPYLLQGSDASSTCLVCHAHSPAGSYHILAEGPAQTLPSAWDANTQNLLNYTPGGDFAWLEQEFSWSQRNELVESGGERNGHNVRAADFGLAYDSRANAPGGTWTGGGFGCISCHDPHGRYRYGSATGAFTTTGLAIKGSGSYGDGSNPKGTRFIAYTAGQYTAGAYRILGGVGYLPKSGNGFQFVNDPPIALAPSTYNQSESAYDAASSYGQVVVAYGSGMSEWCQNCHTNMHSNAIGGGLTRHPAGNDAHLNSLATVYNTYVKTGDLGGGSDQYDSLVPFEFGTDRASLRFLTRSANETTPDAANNNNPLPAPAAGVAWAAQTTSNVMCLSCHRAHASAFDSMMRWNMDFNEFLTDANGWKWEKGDEIKDANNNNASFSPKQYSTGRNALITNAGYYLRPGAQYGAYQRSLCNKCHGKD